METKIEIRDQVLFYCDCNFLSNMPHIHNEIELIYVKKGSSICHADNKTYTVSDGNFFLAFPNQVHYYENCVEGEYYIFIFPTEFLYNMESIFISNYPETNVFPYDKRTSSLINEFIHSKNMYIDNIRIGLINILLPLLLSQTTLTPRIKTDTPTIQKILYYCNKNFTKNISLDDVSSALYISKDHISFLLNKKLNIQFNQYINALRVNRACQLMKKDKKSLAYISEESGFGSIRTFNRVFKQIMGTTPLQYYKQVNTAKHLKKHQP